MFMEIGLEHPVDHRAERERWLANRATIAALAAALLAFTGVNATVAGFRTSDSAAVHALVTAPFPLAVVAAALSFRLRRELSAVRQQQAAIPRDDAAGRQEEDTSSDRLAAPVSRAASWKRICCPVDFSKESWFAMEEAAFLAWRFGADLTLVNVRGRAPAWRAADALASGQALDQGPLAAQQRMSEWADAAERITTPPVAYSLLTGDPIQEIVRFAGEGRFDVLVMGTSGEPGRGAKSPGSIASRVVLEAPCSVVVARPRVPQTERRTG